MAADRPGDARGRVLAARLLKDGMTVRIRVDGTSMRPFLRSGAEVELVPVTVADEVRPGDIVLTERPGDGQRLHRVVRLRPDGRLQTRGDACLRPDPAVPRDAVLGQVRRVRGRGGRWRACAPRMLSRGLAFVLLGISLLALATGLAPEAGKPASDGFRSPS